MRRIVLTALLGFVLPASAAIVLAGEDKKAPAPAPKASPAESAAIQKLIEQLGADDFRAREEASTKLGAYGAKARGALEAARRGTGSPEVRWRSEQLLRRISGAREKPLGAEGAPATPGPTEVRKDRTEFDEMLERVRKQMEAMMKGRGTLGGLGGTARRSPFLMRRLEAPGLVLERSLTGPVTLRVKRDVTSQRTPEKADGSKGEAKVGDHIEDVYKGHSLKDILAQHPDLAKHAGMAELKRQDAEHSWPGIESFREQLKNWPRIDLRTGPNGTTGFTISSSQGVEIQHDAKGVTVKLREKDKDGNETVREFKGKTLEEIKAKNPELADKLGGTSVSFRIGRPDFFWPGRQRARLDPLRPTTPSTPSVGSFVFGLTLTDVSDALRSHIGVDAGQGALVHNVIPGTQAHAMAILRNDVITKVNGKAVTKTAAADTLRAAGASRAALTIELIRKGKTLTLTR